MPATTEAIDIDASPNAIFPWLIEPERLARWIGGFVGSEMLTDGGARLGARSRDTLSEGGRSFVVETEITEFEPGRLMTVRINARGMQSTDSYRLSAEGAGTRLEYTSDMRLSGLLRLMAPLIARQLRARAERDLATLKREVEAA